MCCNNTINLIIIANQTKLHTYFFFFDLAHSNKKNIETKSVITNPKNSNI